MTGTLVTAVTAPPTALAETSELLIDVGQNRNLGEWRISSDDWDPASRIKWSVSLKTLHGGRQEGVQVLEVDNGRMRFRVVPTRGFHVWDAHSDDIRLGWDSPVQEIAHPRYIDLNDRGGLGWLNGFGGWMTRAGIGFFGAPGNDNGTPLTLHGNIDNTPASLVEVSFRALPEPTIVVKGIVNETQMFGPALRLTSEISTPVGSASIRFEDQITNLKGIPQEYGNLYHTNFGAPLLGKGAKFIAPVRTMAPRNARAVEGMAGWSDFAGPGDADYTEQVYLAELFADADGISQVMLKSPDGTKAARMSFDLAGSPYFSLWKNEGPEGTGYVTGLEPGTGYPYNRSVERAGGRVPVLQSHASARSTLQVDLLTSAAEVAKAQAEIEALQIAEPRISNTPLVP
ncbi:aldose 1-epimerase family protein [Paracoccus caeni]|uniref:Aldose 1-epimerase family protein n=1 Tax=Paracoccus caeni TaxID=657651 RepID=A0A934SIP0_9RHOB|nr:aldose 1-epimerase family protein [Paracoccus caeni]MBK4215158.1 aldose 1-epimerase family protein [Paracoccus caeni]